MLGVTLRLCYPKPMIAVTPSILILNGPNMNLLGQREPHIYGRDSLADLEALCQNRARELELEVEFRQSNEEGALINAIHAARGVHDGLIINAAAYSHTSLAILDALRCFEQPIIEVHLSNLAKREAGRQHSLVSAAVKGVITGFGIFGYALAIDAMAQILEQA